MSFSSDVLVHLAVLIDELDRAIGESHGEQVAGALAEGHPVVVDRKAIKLEPLGGLVGVDVPSIDDIVVADAEWNQQYLVNSLKEHHETEVHMSSCFAWPCRLRILNRMI